MTTPQPDFEQTLEALMERFGEEGSTSEYIAAILAAHNAAVAQAVREFAERLKIGASPVRYDAERYPNEPNGETDEVESDAVFVSIIDAELLRAAALEGEQGKGE